jgi:hypothetical protein
MAEKKTAQGSDAVDVAGTTDHDRVAMLSIAKDGSLDQHDPEIIGDKEFAVEAAKRQFAERAVSAVDVEKRGASAAPAGAEEVSQDPEIEALKKEHDKAASAAEKDAESTVNSLHKG